MFISKSTDQIEQYDAFMGLLFCFRISLFFYSPLLMRTTFIIIIDIIKYSSFSQVTLINLKQII